MVLHMYCDKDSYAQQFVAQNMHPAHLATDMEHRNFTTSTHYCYHCKKRNTTSSPWVRSTCMSQAFRAPHGVGGESALVGIIQTYYK